MSDGSGSEEGSFDWRELEAELQVGRDVPDAGDWGFVRRGRGGGVAASRQNVEIQTFGFFLPWFGLSGYSRVFFFFFFFFFLHRLSGLLLLAFR
jgi:hypothetical protein